MPLGAAPRTGCIDYSCVTRKSNCCKEIEPRPPLRAGCIDYSCVTRKSNCRREILPKPVLRAGCIDYSCVTRKSNCCKDILPQLLLRTGYIDYSCVTRKSNCCKEMNVFGEVPIIPVSHVSLIAPMTYGRDEFFPSYASVCAQRDKRSLWPTDVIRRQVQGFVISASPSILFRSATEHRWNPR